MTDTSLTRREFIRLVGAGSAVLALGNRTGASDPGEGRKPNIVLILADDLGYGELGCQGNKEIPTPYVDSIASAGVRFTNGYVSCPVCSPTRAGLMTGRYQERFGHELNPGPAVAASTVFGLPLTETTLATRLKAAGYTTGIVGKWHLGYEKQYHPLRRGFDEFFGFTGGAHHYNLSPDGPETGTNAIMRGDEHVEEKDYLTDAFGREAVSFINRHKQEPFLLYLAFNAVHSPLQAPRKYLDRFCDIKDTKRKTFCAMLSAMDDAVGGVLKALRTNGLDDNTLVFFLSDNGGPTLQTTSGNGPLHGYKGQVYEGGIRIPYMVRWPGHVPAGKVIDKPIISLDIAPTALAAAGVKASDAKFDGVDMVPFLNGSAAPHDVLYWRFGAQHAVRDGDWKLLLSPAGKTELYDLSADIGEKNDLAERNPEKVKELRARYNTWNAQLVDPLWHRQTPVKKKAARQRNNRRSQKNKAVTPAQ